MTQGLFRSRGQVIPLFAIASIALLSAVALGVDVAVMYFNWQNMQKAVDSAALAGATELPEQPDVAKTLAQNYAQSNGLLATEVTTTVTPDDQQLTVSATRSVPYYFGRVLGLTAQLVKVSSTVGVTGTSCIGCADTGTSGTTPFTPTYGSTTGQYGLVPIGLQSTTTYTYNQYIQLAYNGQSNNGQWGPGNWGYLTLGSTGGKALRQNVADGYSGPIQVDNWVDTQTGIQVGNGSNGLQDRINTALQSTDYAAGTFSSHKALDPRVMFVPLVDWNNPNGKAAVEVLGFASIWLDSVTNNGKTINAHFISQVAPDSLPNTSAPYAGTLGAPILMK